MTTWTDFVKAYASKKGISYGCALSDKGVSDEYRLKNPKKLTKAKAKKVSEGQATASSALMAMGTKAKADMMAKEVAAQKKILPERYLLTKGGGLGKQTKYYTRSNYEGYLKRTIANAVAEKKQQRMFKKLTPKQQSNLREKTYKEFQTYTPEQMDREVQYNVFGDVENKLLSDKFFISRVEVDE